MMGGEAFSLFWKGRGLTRRRNGRGGLRQGLFLEACHEGWNCLTSWK